MQSFFHNFFVSQGLALIFLGILSVGCSELFPDQMAMELEQTLLNFPRVAYDVVLEGADDPYVKSIIEESAQLIRLQDKPPISTNALRYRAREDMIRIQQALMAHGYFESSSRFHIKHYPQKKTVVIQIQSGSRYKVAGFQIDFCDADESIHLSESKLARILNLTPGDDVDYTKVFEAALRLQRYFHNRGYPFATVQEPEGYLDRQSKQITYYFPIHLGMRKTFGPSQIIGQNLIAEHYIQNRISWKSGDLYDERLLEKTKRKLIESELFSGVYLKPVEDEEQITATDVPIRIEVKEGPPRVIGGGIKYSLTDGYSLRTYWQHKNFWGSGQKLGLLGQLGQRESFIQLTYDIPDLIAPNFDLLTKLRAKYEITKAYRGASYYATGKFKHQYNDWFAYFLGGDYEFSNLRRDGNSFKRQFWGIPVGILIDTSNDPLNPIKGGKLDFEMTPYYGQFGLDNKMLRLRGHAIYYWRLIKKDTLILASWIRAGAIYFARGSEIPLNKRLYAGGAGSVRAYGYQLLGPVNHERKPEGGRGLFEFGVEPRFHITEKFGLSAFFEGGSITKNDVPTIKADKFLYGAGIGVKYYTEIGPFRVDFAVPLKRRKIHGKKIDAPFQIYLSIGQAF
jgi:translocation and assembly module TamA